MYIKCATCQQIFDSNDYRGGFPSHDEFVATLALLEAQLSYLEDYLYRCNDCQALWELSLPDNAYRGYLRRKSLNSQRIDQRLAPHRNKPNNAKIIE